MEEEEVDFGVSRAGGIEAAADALPVSLPLGGIVGGWGWYRH